MVTNELDHQALAQLRRGVLQHCVLAALEDRDRYGFELVRFLSESYQLVASEGTVYPLLSRLRRTGLVATTWSESDHGPPRRYYQLTDEGRAAVKKFRREWQIFRDNVDGLLEETLSEDT